MIVNIPVLDVLIRSVVAILFLVICARLTGVRQISQLTFYDYVSGITIGSIAGTMCIDRSIPFYYSMIGIAVFSTFVVLMAFLTDKSIIVRRVLTGTAKVLIDDGNFVAGNMRSAHFDVDDVLRELRNQGYFSVSEVKFAILETNGKLSVLPYSAFKPVSNQAMNIQAEDGCIESNVIIDGEVMEQNLSYANKNLDWLRTKLAEMNLDVADVMLGTLDDKGNLACYEKGKTSNKNTAFQ